LLARLYTYENENGPTETLLAVNHDKEHTVEDNLVKLTHDYLD